MFLVVIAVAWLVFSRSVTGLFSIFGVTIINTAFSGHVTAAAK
jgi:hypothetical protein